MKHILPHPILSLLICVVWIMLANEISPGHVVLGLALGVLIPLSTARFWPRRLRVKSLSAMIEYAALVLFDIVVSNIHVAKLVLFRPTDKLRSVYVTVPLDLTRPELIAMLAGTCNMTPGTVCADLSADGRALLVHCLDLDDPQSMVDLIKNRYERRLKRIFE